ncbi:MAG TPA: SGNH hydrolase domain-containing protein [Solirubrobacteraceae bacterium]|nr:SGNH hydrolase domain-containing protein [Solirubrobacteraceae bacterium]
MPVAARRRALLGAATALAVAGVAGAATPADEPCFGAAARDRVHPCENPALRTTVYPTPRQARWFPEAPCARVSRSPAQPCEFGVRGPEATEAVALIGDSHAVHWRAAVAVAAQREGWRAVSFTRVGCPLSTTTKLLGRHAEAACRRWQRRVLLWLARRPQFRTVIVSQLAGSAAVRGAGDQFELQVRGFAEAWERLPPAVERVVVIRDTPRRLKGAPACVMRAARAGREPGRRCAAPRGRVLVDDPAAVAAQRSRSRRVELVDMTRWFCDRTRCFPVVGGALVHQDRTHQTAVWNATLGAYLLRELRRGARARAPSRAAR